MLFDKYKGKKLIHLREEIKNNFFSEVDNIPSIKATNKEVITLEVSGKQGMVHFFASFIDGTTAHGEMPYYFIWRKWMLKDATLQDEISLFREHPEILERLYVSYCLIKHEEAEVGSSDPEYLRYREDHREMSIIYRIEEGVISLHLETYGGQLGKIIFVEANDFFSTLKKLLE